MDCLTSKHRRKNMFDIRSKNTKPEKVVHPGLWKRGFRYQLNYKRLPGHPCLVLRKNRTSIVGCFWHGHHKDMLEFDSTESCKIPKTSHAFWVAKIRRNRERDSEEQSTISTMGWQCIIVRESELVPQKREETLDSIAFTWNHIWLQDHHAKAVQYLSMNEDVLQISMAAEFEEIKLSKD